jgi:hypothetical protein
MCNAANQIQCTTGADTIKYIWDNTSIQNWNQWSSYVYDEITEWHVYKVTVDKMIKICVLDTSNNLHSIRQISMEFR